MGNSVRDPKHLRSAAFIALMSTAITPLYGQTLPTPAPDETPAEVQAQVESEGLPTADQPIQADDIVVTGSSIRGAPAVGSNLISVGRDAIEENAVQSVQELLKTVPAIGGANAASQGGITANDAAGAAVAQIHGIGGANSSSTLVVIDGHRFPLTGIIRNLPDPNFIPPNAIERVEVLAEGASSIYGSDAVAGVLNFITRRKFSGVEATAQHGWADGKKDWSATLSLGSRWDTGGAAAFYSYSDRGSLAVADRPFVGADQRPRGGTNFGNFACSPASIQPAGQSLIFLHPYSGPGIVNTPANSPCDPQARSDLIPHERRHSLMVKLDQEVGERLTLSGDVAFSTRSSAMRNSVTVAHGQGSTSTVPQPITATAFGPGSSRTSQINPFYVNPTGSSATQQTVRWDGNDLFPDGALQTSLSETFYGHARADYKISDDWQVAAFAVAGVNTARTTIIGSICQSCFLLALNGSTNGNGNLTEPAIPNTNVIVTGVPLTTANAVDVWNPRATNRTSPEVLRRLQDSRTFQATRQTMQQYNVTLNGTLFALPGGDVKIAVGGDMTKYSQEAEVVDANGTGPASTGSNYVAVKYLRSVKSVFGEILIPIIGEEMGVPAVRSFVVNVSGRYDHYDEFGSIENPKFAFNWEVIEGLKIRGNYATSFVAPQFSTYGPDVLGGIKGLSVDSFFGPRSQFNLPLDNYPEARSLPGCNAPGQVICAVGSGTPVNGMVIEGANPDVRPLTGTTWAIGADFTPTFLPGFSASLTYWHTAVKGASGSPPINIIANSPLYRDLIKIYPNGATAAEIEEFRRGRRQRSPLASGPIYISTDARNRNVYNLVIEGIDFDINYRHRFDWGRIRVGVTGTYKTRFEQSAGEGEPAFSALNRHGATGTFPSVQLDARAYFGVDAGPVSASMSANHTGSHTFWGNTAINPVISTNGLPVSGGDPVDAFTTVDANLSYDLGDMLPGNVEVFVNVDNVFDAMPPFTNTSAGQAPAFGFSGILAFPMGRVVTVGARAKF
jgi:iron complex outermembrane recepter protein